ncbi:hypothetical protein CBL_05358 [Carabus blaptoides fortunei]
MGRYERAVQDYHFLFALLRWLLRPVECATERMSDCTQPPSPPPPPSDTQSMFTDTEADPCECTTCPRDHGKMRSRVLKQPTTISTALDPVHVKHKSHSSS